MSDKSTLSKAFNNLLFEFIDDILLIFPENVDVKQTKTALELFRKANPTSIIKAWYQYVCIPYKDIIFGGDISFFFDKDYSEDLASLSNGDDIIKAIDRIRQPIKNMSDDNKKHSTEYIQKLCKLTLAYI